MKGRIIILAGAAALAGCGRSHPEPKGVAAAAAARVTVRPAEQAQWPVVLDVPGTVRAATSSTLASRVLGYLQEVRVRAGDRVTGGQVVAVVDSRELDLGLASAEAAQQEAENSLAEAETGVASAQAQVELARATFARMKTLFEKKSLSDQEFDEVMVRLRTAEAALAGAQSRRAQGEARLAKARQSVATATVMRGYAEIRAPFAGIVTERLAEPGQLATPGAPLVTVEREGAYQLEAPVPESLMGQVRPGQTAQVQIDGRAVSARVTEIVPAVDAASRAFSVKASLPSSITVRAGMFGRLQLVEQPRPVVLVPAGAIAERGAIASVLTAEQGIARQRIVTLGERRGDAVEVISGLNPGELVLYPRPAGLMDGARIEVTP